MHGWMNSRSPKRTQGVLARKWLLVQHPVCLMWLSSIEKEHRVSSLLVSFTQCHQRAEDWLSNDPLSLYWEIVVAKKALWDGPMVIHSYFPPPHKWWSHSSFYAKKNSLWLLLLLEKNDAKMQKREHNASIEYYALPKSTTHIEQNSIKVLVVLFSVKQKMHFNLKQGMYQHSSTFVVYWPSSYEI